MLDRFSMQSCKSGDSPMSKGDKLHAGQCPRNQIEKNEMDKKPYARLVGSLMYAQVCTRPDLAFAVSMLARFQSNPGLEHWVAGKKVLRYLQRTKNNMLVFRRIEKHELEVIGYSDASYKSDYDDLKSTSGYIFMMAGGAISWKSVKQSLTATSTMQAEYIAVHEATGQALWLRNFLLELKVVDFVQRPLKIFCDNAAAVFFAKNNKSSTASRNINVKYFAVRESIRDDEIEVIKIGTLSQLADPLTKAIVVAPFQNHASNMGVAEDFDSLV